MALAPSLEPNGADRGIVIKVRTKLLRKLAQDSMG
jgi:hypothetical protein